MDEFNNDDDDEDCELPAYVQRPQAVAKRNQMAIFSASNTCALIVNNCAINSDKSSYTCNCIVLCLIKVRSNCELY